MLPCSITIKHTNNFASTLSINKFDMLRRECSTKSRYGISKTSLMHGNNVCIAFANNSLRLSCNSLFCYIVSKEVLALIKDSSIPCIEILRSVFNLFGNSTAKSNGSSLLVMDREHYTIIKPIADSTITLNSKVSSNHLLRGKATFTQVCHKCTSTRCISQLPAFTDCCPKSTTRKIGASCLRAFSPSTHKH